MREIFVDTSAWYAIEDGSDADHDIALSFKEEIAENCHLVTTNYVLDETYTLLLLNISYNCTVKSKNDIDLMTESGILVVVYISEPMERSAWEVFERSNIDKEWSFTDCTSKVVMDQRKINEVFAFDHHFEQMGFVKIP